MSSNPLASLPPVGLLFDGIYFGAILSTAFYGITCMQTFVYYVHYQNDPMRTKIFVAALWALNTIHEALTVSGVYKYTMTGLVAPSLLLVENPELVLLFTGLAAVPAQGFFIYRIYVVSGKNIVVPLLWVVLEIIRLLSDLIYVAKALYSADGVHVVDLAVLTNSTFSTLATLCLSVGAAADILIAIFLTFLLLRLRTKTGVARTTHILQRLTVFAVNTGIWTAMFALLTIILLHVFPTYPLYMVAGLPLCSLYCNTLLANLNGREYILGGDTDIINMDSVANLGSQVSESANTTKQPGAAQMVSCARQGVWKTTEVETFSDADQPTTSENIRM